MSTDDIINKYLGVETEDSKPESKPPVVVRKEDKETDVDNDHDYSREALYDLIQKGQEALTKAQDNLKALSGALQQVNLFLADLEKEQSEQTYNDVKIEDVAQEGEN